MLEKLEIIDVAEGKSEQSVEPGDYLIMNYRGKLIENGVEFDSSYKRNQPFQFQIGLNQVIQGWEQGILGMRVGGKRTLNIPASMAYGNKAAGDLIPPNSDLTFDVELLNALRPFK